jgi:cardiolipin synthase A/B
MLDTTWKFYLNAEDAWQAMYEDCKQATRSILLEQYIFTADRIIGDNLIHLLIEKAKAGIEVRIVLDGAGSFLFSYSRRVEEMRRAGVELIFFKPIVLHYLWKYSSWFFRDHRKLMVVDGKIGHTGGVGINGRMKNWRDTHVRIEGSVVKEMEEAFYTIRARAVERMPRRYPRRTEFDKEFHYVTNAPHFRRRYLYHGLVEKIRTAKEYIYITSPYFVPDGRIFRLLRLAAKRGVDVRIITPFTSDHLLVDLATYSFFGISLRNGIKLYTYADQVLHAKSVIIDGNWASVGSSNLDNLSLLFNYEGNIISTNQQFIAELRSHFSADVQRCIEIQRHEWRHRPLWQKVAEVLTWPFHKLL